MIPPQCQQGKMQIQHELQSSSSFEFCCPEFSSLNSHHDPRFSQVDLVSQVCHNLSSNTYLWPCLAKKICEDLMASETCSLLVVNSSARTYLVEIKRKASEPKIIKESKIMWSNFLKIQGENSLVQIIVVYVELILKKR